MEYLWYSVKLKFHLEIFIRIYYVSMITIKIISYYRSHLRSVDNSLDQIPEWYILKPSAADLNPQNGEEKEIGPSKTFSFFPWCLLL